MITLRLWKAFKHPPSTHPIFQRLLDEAEDEIELFSLLQQILLQGQIWLWPLLFMLNMRALLLMVFSGTLYGAIWSVQISGRIATERQNRRYDLLCLSPLGAVGASWAICTGCLHQKRAFEQINSQEAWSVRLILFIPIVISLPLIVRQLFAVTLTTSLIGILAVILVFYVDHVQSVLFGGLLGLLAFHHAPSRLDCRLWALAAFLGLQIITYLLLALVSVFILPALHPIFPGIWYSDIVIPLLSVLTFFLVRETILKYLWHVLVREGDSPAEWYSLTETAIQRTTSIYADPQIVARTP
jgi:hypothetical protein